MKSLLIIFLLLTASFAYAQNELPTRHIQLIAGHSFHGSGDLSGFSFTTEYAQNFKKRFCWTFGLGATIHDSYSPGYYNNEFQDDLGSTTGGIQISSNVGYSIIKTNRHEFQVRLGTIMRYQSSSDTDIESIYYPATTGLPFPVYSFSNTTPQRTLSFGGNSQVLYNYTINNILSMGMLAGFQPETNGDAISQISFTVGRRF